MVRLSSKCLFGAPLANFASFGLKLVSLETTITPSGVSNLKAKLSVIGGYGVRNAVTFTAAVCHAILGDVLGDHQLAQVGASIVLNTGCDVETVQLEIALGDRRDSLGAEGIDRRRKAARPDVLDDVAVVEIVIGMVMANQDVLY